MKRYWILLLATALLLAACAKASPDTAAPAAPTETAKASAATEGPAVPAEQTAEPTAALDPASYIAEARAALAAGETAENLTAALEGYLKALELQPDSGEALMGAADVYIRQGDFDRALAFLKERAGDSSDETIQSKIAELEAGNAKDSEGKPYKLTGKPEDGPVYIHLYDYDAQGRLARVTWLDAEGNEQDHVDVIYAESGKPLTGADHVLSSSWAGSLIHNAYAYDDQGRMTSAKRTLPGEWEEEIRYYYDEQGNQIRWETYENNELVLIDEVEDFDDRGNPQKRSNYFVQGQTKQLNYYQLTKYDYDAFTKTERTYDASGALTGWSVYSYSSDWALRHVVSYDADGTIEHEEDYQ